MELYYYLTYCLIVAISKTIYYIKVEERRRLAGATRKQMNQVILITFAVSFALAPITMVELLVTIIKNKKGR